MDQRVEPAAAESDRDADRLSDESERAPQPVEVELVEGMALPDKNERIEVLVDAAAQAVTDDAQSSPEVAVVAEQAPPAWACALQPVARGLAKTIGRPFEIRRYERQIQQYMEDMLSARTPSARRLRVDLILWLAQAERGPDPAQKSRAS